MSLRTFTNLGVKSILSKEQAFNINRLLTALSDPMRLQIVFLLGEQGRLNVNEITTHFQLTRPAISHHLKVLKEAEILNSEKQGQEVYYWLASEKLVNNLRNLADFVENCDHNNQKK